MIECNIDDMNGELYSALMQNLFKAGASDVTYQGIYMKKNRPATKVSVLTRASMMESLETVLLMETTTFGLRKYPVERTILERKFETFETELGSITFKYGMRGDEIIKVTPEYETLKSIAERESIPLRQVYEFANYFIEKEIIKNRLSSKSKGI